MKPISDIAASLGLHDSEWEPYGRDVAKVDPKILARPRSRPGRGRLVLVSAITPTPAGEGKTTTSIGLAQALAKLGQAPVLALREPSLGPCLGIKGGAVGGGASTVQPAERINLHFTGDFHAITTANNLLAAMIDNHLYFGNPLGIDPRRILWRRCLDMNDRALRRTVIGLGGHKEGVPRETGFDITAASEVMAMLCLAEDAEDLRRRIDRTLVAFTYDGKPVTAKDLGAAGAMIALLADALKPNLVQTVEGVPAFVHGGPFANIAHGCNSLLATRLALHLGDWAITEAGFAFDLGAEKFFDIKCRASGLDTAAVVLVATVRALKFHGGHSLETLGKVDPAAVAAGLPNLEKHVENIHEFGEQPIVALNKFATDAPEEIEVVRRRCQELGVPFAVSEHFAKGGDGALELAKAVVEFAEHEHKPFHPLYALEAPLPEKVFTVASKMYGARKVVFTKQAERDLEDLRRLGYEKLPICIAKTQNSLSDDPKLRGRPQDFEVTVRSLHISAGAGFVVVMTGEILRMPGLPKKPLAESLDLRDGRVVGLL
ncbi:MAG: formate--tetrahydrofolate ligase [Myxococcales bacterium]